MRDDVLSTPLWTRADGANAESLSADTPQSKPIENRVYKNQGNEPVVAMIPVGCRRILDVGCGAGDNAALVRQRMPDCEIVGITRSEAEAERARKYMAQCLVADIEQDIPEGIRSKTFDCIVFSHVLEHLLHPAEVVMRMTALLPHGGRIVIAVPNVMFFKVRMQFLRGKFEYQPDGGILDDTHLHFYTYFTAGDYLLSHASDLRVVSKEAPGHFPFCGMRGRVISQSWSKSIDSWAGRKWPNFFGPQILLSAEKL